MVKISFLHNSPMIKIIYKKTLLVTTWITLPRGNGIHTHHRSILYFSDFIPLVPNFRELILTPPSTEESTTKGVFFNNLCEKRLKNFICDGDLSCFSPNWFPTIKNLPIFFCNLEKLIPVLCGGSISTVYCPVPDWLS